MKFLKSIALLISLSTLASCSEEFEYFPEDVYSINETSDTKAIEPTDSTASNRISIHIDEPEVEDIDYVVNI